jgi:hypothetical protein
VTTSVPWRCTNGTRDSTVASFGLIHHFEVLLRNAIDGAIGAGQPQTPIKDTWLLDFEILQPDGIKQVITALERLEKGKVVTRGRIVAGLSFGFWAGLFGRRYEELWRHRLRAVFPHGTLTRKDLSTKVRLIQHFRNRVAHHDSLLDQDVQARLDDMLTIAGWIDPAARAWLAEHADALEKSGKCREQAAICEHPSRSGTHRQKCLSPR